MCDPITIAGMALSGVGSLISSYEQQQNAEDRAAARNAELERMRKKNKVLSDEAYSYFDKRLKDQGADTQQAQQEAATQDKSSEIAANSQDIPSAASAIPTTGSAPKVVQTEMAKRLSDTLSGTKAQAERLGQLGGYNQMMFNNSLKNQATARSISTPVGFAQSNAQMLPYMQDAAELNVGAPSGLGSLLTTGGYLVAAKPWK